MGVRYNPRHPTMRVYLFIEHYPNPYKPWIDTQVIQLLTAGHDVRIFSEAFYASTIHDEVRQHDLVSKTSYYPSTLKSLGRDGLRAAARLLMSPFSQAPRAIAARRGVPSLKHQLLMATRALLFPDEAPDVCYIHNLVTAASLTFLHRIYPSTRVCLYFHGGEVGGQTKVGAEAAIFDTVDAVITSTRFAGQQAVDRGCAPEKIAIVPLGFNMSAYRPSPSRTYRPDGKVRFASVGRMSPEKGFLYALKAVKALLDAGEQHFTYTLIGEGIQFAELRAFAQANGLGNVVRFAGERTRAEVAAELENADVLILPSIVTDVWAETQATVVQEALLMGCLTMTTIAGGVPESNAPIMAQFSYPPANVDALVERMRQLMALPSTDMARLAAVGLAFAREKYDIAPLLERIMSHAVDRLPADDPSRFLRPTASPA